MSHLIRSQQITHKGSSKNLDKAAKNEASKPVSEEVVPVAKSENKLISDTYQVATPVEVNESESKKENFELQILTAKEDGYQKGVEDGFRNGYAKGIKEGEVSGISLGREAIESELSISTEAIESEKQKLINTNTRLNRILNHINSELSEEIALFEAQGVELVFEVLIKILGVEATNKTLIEKTLSQCLQKCMSNKIIRIRVSPQDFELVNSGEINETLDGLLEKIEVVPDAELLPGGCVFETDGGNLDSRLDVQLEKFKKFLSELYRTPSYGAEADR